MFHVFIRVCQSPECEHYRAPGPTSDVVLATIILSQPIYIYPAGQYEGSVTTILPGGKEMTLYMQDVDIENADQLKRMQEITVLESIEEIEGVVRRHIEED